MLRLVVLFCAVLVVKSQTTPVNQCINHAGDLPINTYIEGCDATPCRLTQLEDAVINIIFKAPSTTRTMKTVATAYLLFLVVDHDLQENANTCNFLTNSYCPVIAGEVLQYTLKMYIEPLFFVGVQATVEFRVVDDNGDSFLCIRVPIRIVANPNPPSLRNGNSTVTADMS